MVEYKKGDRKYVPERVTAKKGRIVRQANTLVTMENGVRTFKDVVLRGKEVIGGRTKVD